VPRPRPLTGPEAAKGTLAHRLTRTADRLRQFYTRFGLRSKRVFLVWTRWTGEERGEGREEVLAKIELLPTPRVSDRTAVQRRPYTQGVTYDGTIRVDQISAGAYTRDQLTGIVIPGRSPELQAPRATIGRAVDGTRSEPKDDRKVDFYYLLQDDGRGDNPGSVQRYRLMGGPSRKEGSLYFAVNLEKAEEEPSRFGRSYATEDDV